MVYGSNGEVGKL